VPRLSGDDEVEQVGGRGPGLEWRDDDVHAASVGHGGHPLVRLHADDLAPAIKEQLRRDAGAAPDVQHPSDVRAVDRGIDHCRRVRRSRPVILFGVVAEREAAVIIHVHHPRRRMASEWHPFAAGSVDLLASPIAAGSRNARTAGVA
jgi:hypothetical protein